MGRRYGKTLGFGTLGIAAANNGAAVGWGVPTYKNARPAWRFFLSAVSRLGRSVSVNRADLMITFPSGGFLSVYSMDNADAMRGEALHLFLGDEAPLYRPGDVEEIVLPTLADYNGHAILFGTPKGLNWFYSDSMATDVQYRVTPEGLTPWGTVDTSAQIGAEPYSAWFTAPTNVNPLPNIQRAFQLASTRLPSRTFRQEWLAEFVEEGGEVFRRVEDAIIPIWSPDMGFSQDQAARFYPAMYPKFPMDPYPGQFVMAIDWGREHDWTVLGVADVHRRRLVDYDRFRIVDWSLQQERAISMGRKWNVAGGYGELNSMGSPNVEAIQKRGVKIMGFNTNNATKGVAVEQLSLAIENKQIGYPDIPEVKAELKAFTQEQLKSGLTRYGAPAGMHDDTVIMLALLNSAMSDIPNMDLYTF